MRNKRICGILMTIVMVFSMFLIFNVNTFADYNPTGILNAGTNMSEQYMSDGNEVQSNNAMQKYIASGIFGSDCATDCGSAANIETCLNNTSNRCSEAKIYYDSNRQYSTYAASGLKQHDKSSGRLAAAMEGFNENAHWVYSAMMGFGCLTSLLVFIIIFIRITWLPEHATQRRKAMEDIVTSGISVILLGGFWLVIGVFQSMFNRFWETYTVFSKDWRDAANVFLIEYRTLIIGILGIATLTALLMFIKSITSVVIGSASSPQQKMAKMTQVLYCGLAVAGLGGLTIFAGLFWNMLR